MGVLRIAVYPIDATQVDVLRQSVDDSLVPLYRQQPGFQRLSLADCGANVVSVTHWDIEEHAEQGSRAVIEWARTAPGSEGPPTAVYIGREMNSA